MKKMSVLILVMLASTCWSSFAQEYDYYDEPEYDDGGNSNDYPEEREQQNYEEGGYEQPRANCGTNSQGNKYCTYSNGCYEYWNRNGSHYYECPGDELRAEQDAMLKDRLNQMTREASCGTNYPGTVLDETNGNCVCPDQKNGGPGWDSVNRNCPYIDLTQSAVSDHTETIYTPESDYSNWLLLYAVIVIIGPIIAIVKLRPHLNAEKENEKIDLEEPKVEYYNALISDVREIPKSKMTRQPLRKKQKKTDDDDSDGFVF